MYKDSNIFEHGQFYTPEKGKSHHIYKYIHKKSHRRLSPAAFIMSSPIDCFSLYLPPIGG